MCSIGLVDHFLQDIVIDFCGSIGILIYRDWHFI